MRDIFTGLSVPEEECAVVVDVLLGSSLAGYDAHGIMRVPMYADGIRKGTMLPGAGTQVLQETAASVYLDARFGLGPVAAVKAVEMASQKAAAMGIGCASIANCCDVARLGGYVAKPAEDGLLAVVMVNDAGYGPDVAPWGGVEPFLSTNPIAAGIPWEGGPGPVIIDVSTGVSSVGGLKMLRNRGRPAPEGWLIDRDGKSTTDAESFFEEPSRSALLPLGSLLAGHKGFALGLLVDVMAGALSGAGCSTGERAPVDRNGVFVFVVDPAKFASRESFDASVGVFLEKVKSSQRAPGVEEILIPGERARRERQRRLREGIPVDEPTWNSLATLVGELGLKDGYEIMWS